jgi:hypothetical protein
MQQQLHVEKGHLQSKQGWNRGQELHQYFQVFQGSPKVHNQLDLAECHSNRPTSEKIILRVRNMLFNTKISPSTVILTSQTQAMG